MLENMEMDTSIQDETDSLGGNFGPLDSALYTMNIDYAYVSKSKGGATGIYLQFTGEKKEVLKESLWATSGTKKGGKNYYTDGKGNKHYLPGFTIANAISLLTCGKNIGTLETTKKTISIYNPELKKEAPTEVDMLMDIVGKSITLGVLRQTVDKTKLNDSTNEYEPTGETRDENEIVKVFKASNGKTVAECLAKSETADFMPKWEEKWKGVTRDKSKGTGTTAGAPAAQSTGAAAPEEALFGD